MDALNLLFNFIMSVVGCIADPIRRRTKLITDHDTIMEELRIEREQLSSVRTIIENLVIQAKNNGRKIFEEVNTWLAEVEKATRDTVNGTENEDTVNGTENDTVNGTENDTVNGTENEDTVNGTENEDTTSGTCFDCCKVYKLSKEAVRKKKVFAALVTRGNNFQQAVSFPSSPRGIQLVSHNDFTAFDSTTLSFNEALAALGRSRTNIVGLFGMGGIGKTTLVAEIGKKAKYENKFNQVLFAVMSQDPDIRKIQGQLGDMLGLTYTRETEIGRADQLKERIRCEETILVILDDVWNKINLAEIGIPFGRDHEGCKILLTTRREEVCRSMQCDEIIRLKFLEEYEAWELFNNNVGTVLHNPSPEFKGVALRVIRECKGLPLALVVVACALNGKDLEDWKSAAEKLEEGKLEEIDAADRMVFTSLRLSYDYLKEKAAKKCLLLCALFPEDHEINVEELAKYVMGFGLFQGAESFESVKSRVHSTIKDLKASSLLLKTDMANYVKMHDMVRDAALWITTTDSEPFIVPRRMMNWVRDPKLKEAVAISLLACPENTRFFSDQEQYPRLNMLICAQRAPFQLSDACFQGLTTLQVLDLTAAKKHLEMVLPSSLKNLHKLRALLLRRWKLKGDVSMIGSLRNLEILSFSGSLIYELPIELGELSELILLDLSGCKELKTDSYIQVQVRLNRLEEIHMPNKKPMLAFDDDDVDE